MPVDTRALEGCVPLPKKPTDVPCQRLFELRVTEVDRKPEVINRRVRPETKAVVGKLSDGLREGRSGDGHIPLVGLTHLGDFRTGQIIVKCHVRIGIVQVCFRQFATSAHRVSLR